MDNEVALDPNQPLEAKIKEAFVNYLRQKSWGSAAAERSDHDKLSAASLEKRSENHPRRQVLLQSSNGSIVLGYHNENNDVVWAQSGRGKDRGVDLCRDSWSMEDIVVGEIPGCIEYLETLLNEDGTCGHYPLIQRTQYSEIPARLCFFSQWASPDRGVNDPIFYIDTKNLCEECYRKAVPRGFNVWSTSYFDEYNKKLDQDYYQYFRGCILKNEAPETYDMDGATFLRLYWPLCYSAKKRDLAFENEPYPLMPGATIAHECWRWLVWNRAPFYVDQICISPSYRIYEDPERALVEDQRISQLNASAYIGAKYGILGLPPGGRSEWTMVELRILGNRALCLPEDFGDPAALTFLGPGYIVHGDTYWVPQKVKYSGRLKVDPDYSEIGMRQAIADRARAPSETMPEEKRVLNELRIQIGRPLGPTPEEVERFRLFPMRDYHEIVRKYEELLSSLKNRMSASTAPVSKALHSTVEQSNASRHPTGDLETSTQALLTSLALPTEGEIPDPHEASASSDNNKPVFFRPYAGRTKLLSTEPSERDNRISGRLNRLYCHDASPYVYRGPYNLKDSL